MVSSNDKRERELESHLADVQAIGDYMYQCGMCAYSLIRQVLYGSNSEQEALTSIKDAEDYLYEMLSRYARDIY